MILDLNEEHIQLVISHDGQTVWVNTAKCCVLRASKIPAMIMEDRRKENDE